MDRATAIEALAARLHWKLEHIDPTGAPGWDDLEDDLKEDMRIVVRALLCDREALRAALI